MTDTTEDRARKIVGSLFSYRSKKTAEQVVLGALQAERADMREKAAKTVLASGCYSGKEGLAQEIRNLD